MSRCLQSASEKNSPWRANVISNSDRHTRVWSHLSMFWYAIFILIFSFGDLLFDQLPLSPTHNELHKTGNLIVLLIFCLREGSELKPSRISITFLTQLFNQLYMYPICCRVRFETFLGSEKSMNYRWLVLDHRTYISHRIFFSGTYRLLKSKKINNK